MNGHEQIYLGLIESSYHTISIELRLTGFVKLIPLELRLFANAVTTSLAVLTFPESLNLLSVTSAIVRNPHIHGIPWSKCEVLLASTKADEPFE